MCTNFTGLGVRAVESLSCRKQVTTRMKTRSEPRTRRRFKPTQIANLLDQIARTVRQGHTIVEACRAAGVSEASYYRWRAGGTHVHPRADQLRETVILAAKAIFLRDGYAASLDSIANAAGVARQTLYNLFGSKERLFRAVVQTIFVRMLTPVFHVDPKASFEQTLLEYARQYVEASLDEEGLGLLRLTVGESRDFPDLGRIVHFSGASRTVPILAEYLKTQIDSGHIRPVDPMIAAESFLGSLVGYARHRALVRIDEATPEWREAIVRHAVGTFMKGVSATGDPRPSRAGRARGSA